MTAFLRSDSHIVQFGLLRGHDAVIPVEHSHRSLDTSMESWSCRSLACIGTFLVSNYCSCLLRSSKFLNEATWGWAGGVLARCTLVCCRHRLYNEVFVIVLTACLHLDGLKLLLQATFRNVGHIGWYLLLACLDSVSGWRATSDVLALWSSSSALLGRVSAFVARIWRCYVIEVCCRVALLNFSVANPRHHFCVGRVLRRNLCPVLARMAVSNLLYHIVGHFLESCVLTAIASGTVRTIQLLNLLSCCLRRVCRVYTVVCCSTCGGLLLMAFLPSLILWDRGDLSRGSRIVLQVRAQILSLRAILSIHTGQARDIAIVWSDLLILFCAISSLCACFGNLIKQNKKFSDWIL